MKTRYFLAGAAAVACLMPQASFAVCSQIPLVVKDGSGNNVSMSSATSADGACKTYIDEDTSSQFHTDLGLISTPTGTTGDAAYSGSGAATIVGIGKGNYSATAAGATSAASILTATGTTGDTAYVSGAGTMVSVLKGIFAGVAAAIPAGTNRIGYTSDDPCASKTKTNIPFGQQATTFQLQAGVSGQKIYVCSIIAMSGGTASFNIIEGTGATCVTGSELAVVGSTTAANGLPLTPSNGYSQGNGAGSIMVMTNASSGLCVLQSANNTVSGNITIVQQ